MENEDTNRKPPAHSLDTAESGRGEPRSHSPAEAGGRLVKPSFGNMPRRTRFSLFYYLAVFAVITIVQSMFFSTPDVPEWSYSEFRSAIEADRVSEVVITPEIIYGRLKQPEKTPSAAASADAKADVSSESTSGAMNVPTAQTPWHFDRLVGWFRNFGSELEHSEEARQAEAKLYFNVLPLEDPSLLAVLQSHGVNYRGRVESHLFRDIFLNWLVPFAVMFLIWGFLMRRIGRGPNVLQMGQSRAKIYEVDPALRVRFTDVAGADEAIEETIEIVSFLKEPEKFTRLGAKLPKGILLVGPPGTGKTLLARAIAGESGVPFFSLSGSEFMEMFVGVGAARVRDLFVEARKAAPCIVFIDELDAIGKSRAQGSAFAGGGFDERENTLNQLLKEIDGFDVTSGVVILAATNRPEVLDPALLRPGRFDRRVVVDRPTRSGRKAIFQLHTRNLPMAGDVDFDSLAAQTAGMVGADIANVCNEAALLASRIERNEISMTQFQEAIERAIAGPQKKSLVVTADERKRIAFHECGHAMVGYMTAVDEPVQKISIIPRAAGALGYTLQSPLEDRYLLTRTELLGRVRILLGGRAAEEIVFGSVSTGASDDLQKVTRIVRDMLNRYGMSECAPNLSLVDRAEIGYLGQGFERSEHSEHLAQALDEEVIETVRKAYAEAKALLEADRPLLDELAEKLLTAEELDRSEVIAILGDRQQHAADRR
jgi:cell division protease FtsH